MGSDGGFRVGLVDGSVWVPEEGGAAERPVLALEELDPVQPVREGDGLPFPRQCDGNSTVFQQ